MSTRELPVRQGQWLVWCPERGQTIEDGKKIAATYPDIAAKLWARRDDAESVEYLIAKGNETTVVVCNAQDATDRFHFVLTGEAEIAYYARETKAPATEARP